MGLDKWLHGAHKSVTARDANVSMVLLQERGAMRHAVEVSCQIVRERDFKVWAEDPWICPPRASWCPRSPTSGWAKSDGVLPRDRLRDPLRDLRKVARILEGRRDGDRGRCLGVSFRLGAVARHILRGGLRRVPPPIPAA